jgi:hypothetical protein
MRRLLIGLAILAIAFLNFFQFPGHTWLQSDTQIYMPILEHIWDPSVLQKDLIAQHPHVAFTLYDETAVALRKITGLEFRLVLEGEQFVLRVLGIWGVYLIATAAGLSDLTAVLVAAVFSLGATIAGPAVLIFEYEPVPRGFAISLVFLAIGLIAHQRYFGAGAAASAAFLMHPPTVAPFCAVYFVLAFWPAKPPITRRRFAALGMLAAAVLFLLLFSRYQRMGGETRNLFTRLDPAQEQLQRLRASYNWISTWWRQWLAHYLILYAATLLAYWRIRKDVPEALRFFSIGLPLVGILSLPTSYFLLEKIRWGFISQFQPARALLFITAFAMILGAIAATKALSRARYVEALGWLALAYLLPANRTVEWPSWSRVGVVVVLSVIAATAIWLAETRSHWRVPAVGAAIVAPFFLIPIWGGMQNYAPLHSPELDHLSQWARASTGKDAVFLFPDAGQDLSPGVFRAKAVRAVYVDWKTGGQVNFFKELGEEWWSRWQKTMAEPFHATDLQRYRGLSVDYVVLLPKDRFTHAVPVFENAGFIVYRL